MKVGGRDSWVMYGPAYFSREFTARFMPVLEGVLRASGDGTVFTGSRSMGHVKRRGGAPDRELRTRRF